MNKKEFLLIIISVCLSYLGLGQSKTPKDYFNTKVKEGQLATTKKVLRLLEKGQIDSILKLVEPTYLNNKSSLKDELSKAYAQIKEVKDFAEVSEGLIVYEENHNVYKCVYHNTKYEFQLVDIHFFEGDPSSKIAKFKFKDKKTLMNEKADRMKSFQNVPPPVKQ